MPDTKITALTAISTVDPAVDVLPIVDVSDTTMAASGTTKKITSNQILGAGGTATLASATITGDLTVDTSTLKVDSANNRVGIGTASPGFPLDIIGASGVGVRIYESSTGNNNRLQITQEGTETRFNSTYASGSAFYTWQIAGSEQMRLNSTGLGVGVTPTYRLQASVNSGADRDIFSAQVSGATNGFTIKWNHATTTLRVNFANALPTSSAGLASGDVWVDTSAGNVLKVV